MARRFLNSVLYLPLVAGGLLLAVAGTLARHFSADSWVGYLDNPLTSTVSALAVIGFSAFALFSFHNIAGQYSKKFTIMVWVVMVVSALAAAAKLGVGVF